jgi:DNA primase catalytic core
MTYEEYIESIILKIKSSLRQYLSSKGIPVNVNNYFKCPNHKVHARGDANPTAHIFPTSEGDRWWCFRCQDGSDTFKAASYIESLPDKGSVFITNTVPSLAKSLSIEFTPEKYMTDADREVAQMYTANEILMEHASITLQNMFDTSKDNPIVKFMIDRGLDKNDIHKFDLGYITLADAAKLLTDRKITYQVQKEICARAENPISSKIFNENNLLFGLRNHSGRACGFAARNVHYQKGVANQGPKYINVANNRVFIKNSFLYRFNDARPSAIEKGNLYIFEGYTDVISAVKIGVNNAVAVCGVAYTDNHNDLLHDYGIRKITFALDGDEAGKDAALRTIDKLFTNSKRVQPSIMMIPNNDDPDSHIRNNKLYEKPIEEASKEFTSIPTYNLVEFKLINIFQSGKTIEISEATQEFITWLLEYEINPVTRQKYLEMLCKYSGIKMEILEKQINHQEKLVSDEITSQVEEAWYGMLRKGKISSIKERIELMDQARDHLSDLLSQQDGDEKEQQIQMIDDVQKKLASSTVTPINFGWKIFSSEVNIPKDASLAVIGAYPNVGKSIMVKCMAMNVIQNNPDMGVIYFSMDDPKTMTLPGLIANYAGVMVNDIRLPATLPTAGTYRDEVLKKSEIGYKHIKELIAQDRFAIFDQNEAITIHDIETLIHNVSKRMRAKKLLPLVILDSIHSVIDPNADAGIRNDVMSTIRALKRITNTHGIPMIGVAELRKGQNKDESKRPSIRDISETVDIEYRISIGMILHSELLRNKQTPKIWTWTPPGPGMKEQRLPIQEVYVDKNKEAYFKDVIYYKTNPFMCRMEEVSNEYVGKLVSDGQAQGSVRDLVDHAGRTGSTGPRRGAGNARVTRLDTDRPGDPNSW